MAKDKKRSSSPSGKKSMIRLLVILLAMSIFLRYAVMILAFGMLPAFVAAYTDRSPDRNGFRVVLACNLSGVIPYVMKLWQSGITADSVQQMLLRADVWLVMYGSAAVGWGLVWTFPRAAYFFIQSSEVATIELLRRKQQNIVNEWGKDVETAAERVQKNATYTDKTRRND